jgi:hypothetical protein
MQKEINGLLDMIERVGHLASSHFVCNSTGLMEEDSKRLYNPETSDDGRSSIYCIAVQILASCRTDLQYQITDLPASLYINRIEPNLIRGLRMHTEHPASPFQLIIFQTRKWSLQPITRPETHPLWYKQSKNTKSIVIVVDQMQRTARSTPDFSFWHPLAS